MSKLKHYMSESFCYFLTTTTKFRNQVFSERQNAEVLCNVIYNLRRKQKFRLLAFTIMPEHLHLMIIPGKNNSISSLMQQMKSGSARLINLRSNTKGKIWINEFHDYVIRDEKDLIKHLEYVYNNAIKRGLAKSPVEYLWCSANNRFETDLQEVMSG